MAKSAVLILALASRAGSQQRDSAPVVTALLQPAGEEGRCASDADCGGGGAGCYTDGRCLCKPGFVLCGTSCAPIELGCSGRAGVDGRAGKPADSSEEIVDDQALSSPVTKSSVYRLSQPNPATNCHAHTEAAPERIALPISMGSTTAHFGVFYGDSSNNYADVSNTWGANLRTTSVVSGTTLYGRAAASSSEFSGMIYGAYVAKRSTDTNRCVGIASTTSDQFYSNTFTNPVRCIATDLGSADSPSMAYDWGGTDLWVVETESTVHRLSAMKLCKPGPVGCCVDGTCTDTCTGNASEPCPVTWSQTINTGVHDDATVAVNPCTHNALVAYKLWSNNEIRLHVRSPSGTFVSDTLIRTNQPHDDNTGCNGGQIRTCSQGSTWCSTWNPGMGLMPCMGLRSRPQVVTTIKGNQCFALISYEESYTSSIDSKKYLRNRLEIWDITDDSPPVSKMAWVGLSASSANWNHFAAEVSVNGAYALQGYYSDFGGPCFTKFVLRGDKDLFLVNNDDWGAATSVGFPSMRQGPRSGFGTMQTLRTGLGQGQLVATWTEPVCLTQNSCYSCSVADGCSSDQWSFAVHALDISGIGP